MKFHITKNDIRGVDKEFLRVMKHDREYTIELKETKTSRNKRLKLKKTNPHE